MNATGLLNTASNTTVGISDQRAALSVDGRIHEVEQVSIVWIMIATGSSEITNRAPLHRIIRRSIGRGPCRTAIKRRSDVEMPGSALIVGSLVRIITDHGRS